MPIDENPIDALKHQFEMEDLSKSPVTERLLKIASSLPLGPYGKPVEWLKNYMSGQSAERNRLLLETIADEVKKHGEELERTKSVINANTERTRPEVMLELLLDAARKAESTRAKERIKRIGLILFNAIAEPRVADADEVEEMMRVAMELSDRDIVYLKELIKIEGKLFEARDHIPRYDAHTLWINGFWGDRVIPEIDSVFSKLESYGLVGRIAAPNNMNIMADIQNRYVLLPKGARFVALIKSRGTTE
jgi:hypothetical protein